MKLSSLLDDHSQLDEIFLRHQEALLERDLHRAELFLMEYEKRLRTHMKMEEELLMPYYLRAGRIQGGPPEFYIGEHKRMLEALEKIKGGLAKLDLDAQDFNRTLIHIFDIAAVYKSLVEHHHAREENIFYPTLDKVTSKDEAEVLLVDCRELLDN